jgi:plasmid stabilization system protein ParE
LEYEVSLSTKAQRDLRSIHRYIAQDNPQAAMRFCESLLLTARELKNFPDRGRRVAGDASRMIVHESYFIFYEVRRNERRVEILRFWHGARNPRRLRLREEAPVYGAAGPSGAGSPAPA